MRFTIATAALVVGTASATYGYPPAPPAYNTTSVVAPPPVYVTKTVSSYETYCPGPTEITQGTKTYTVTKPETVTITDCPCTITESETPYVPVPTSEAPEVPSYPTEVPSVSPGPEIPYPSSNGTIPAPTYPTGTGSTPAPSQPPTEFPGAASKGGAVGLLAVVGALAAFL